jgi:hypothetical protein
VAGEGTGDSKADEAQLIDGPEQLKRSIDSLQRLYTIVVGLAITEALRAFWLPPTALDPWWANWRTLTILLITIVPFYHGANAHLDQSYLYGFAGKRREKRYALLLDFFVLFVEGVLFFALALSLNDFDRSVRVFQLILLLDILWAGFVYFTGDASEDATHAVRWGLLNVAALVAVTGVKDTTLLNEIARPDWILGVAVLRTAIDYRLCWNFYMARYPMLASVESA